MVAKASESRAEERQEPNRRSWLRTCLLNALLLLGSIAVSVLVVEVALRILIPIKGNEGHLLEDLPGNPLQYRLVPNADAVYYGASVHVNSHGYRGDPLPDATSETELRLVVMGDSMTFGNGTGDDDPYPARLESWLNERAEGWGSRVANLGVPSYNAEQVELWFRQGGLPLEPDLVVYGFFVNDAAPKGTSIIWARPNPGIFQVVVDNSHLLRLIQMQAPKLVTSIRKALGIRARSDGYIDYFQNGTETWKACSNALKGIHDSCREQGIPLVVALIPFWVPFEDYPWENCHAVVRNHLEEIQVPFIDLALEWKEEGINGRDYWIDIHQSHPTREGHELVADSLGRFLEEEIWPTTKLSSRFPLEKAE